jgi:hypothetical protein
MSSPAAEAQQTLVGVAWEMARVAQQRSQESRYGVATTAVAVGQHASTVPFEPLRFLREDPLASAVLLRSTLGSAQRKEVRSQSAHRIPFASSSFADVTGREHK